MCCISTPAAHEHPNPRHDSARLRSIGREDGFPVAIPLEVSTDTRPGEASERSERFGFKGRRVSGASYKF